MREQEDYLDIEFDDDYYGTTWTIIKRRNQRAHRVEKNKRN